MRNYYANFNSLNQNIIWEGWKPPKQKFPRRLKIPCIDYTKALNFFIGASQIQLGMCGVGAILFITSDLFFTLNLESWAQNQQHNRVLCPLDPLKS